MKRWLVIILLAFSTACAPEYSGKTPPPIVDGTIDLTGWNFEADGPVELKGEWGFAWRRFTDPELSFEDVRKNYPNVAQVPSEWAQLNLMTGPDEKL